ncbi:carboxypeptidase-like regulatory domain-containing protein, partial [Terracidiphilus sp.]|uniref:carboxypeptidase-like regulatory domain-containing protein n=1 Tax=Terracidiphilus sp. TaxID=1964191 RepID=UPI003C176D15
FPIVPPARYVITLSSTGFAAQTRTADLLVDQPATINFTLSVQANTVTVDVSSAAETLNFTDASMGNAVGNTTIEALPMDGRNPINLLSLQPGVLYMGNEVSDSRQGAVAGGRSDQGNITLDGMDDNDQIFGTAFSGILRSTLDSTEEFRVTTSNGNHFERHCRGGPFLRRSGQPGHQERNQQGARLALRVLPPHQHGGQLLLQQEPTAHLERSEHPSKIRPQHVWRHRGRTDQDEQAFLLLQL